MKLPASSGQRTHAGVSIADSNHSWGSAAWRRQQQPRPRGLARWPLEILKVPEGLCGPACPLRNDIPSPGCVSRETPCVAVLLATDECPCRSAVRSNQRVSALPAGQQSRPAMDPPVEARGRVWPSGSCSIPNDSAPRVTSALRNVFHVKRRLQLWSRVKCDRRRGSRNRPTTNATCRAVAETTCSAARRAIRTAQTSLGVTRPRTSATERLPRWVSREKPWGQPSHPMNAAIVGSANTTAQTGESATRGQQSKPSATVPPPGHRERSSIPRGQHVSELPPAKVVRSPPRVSRETPCVV